MSISSELMKAILAMDSYNRGYNAGVDFGPGSDAVGTQLGTATIAANKGDADAVNVSFYAAAYNYNGETVISFRGTDDIPLDLTYGYGLGAGIPLVEQAIPAKQFYENVASGDLVGNNNLSFI